MKKLIFGQKQWEQLKSVCEKGYPKEVCGLLFGPLGASPLKVTKITVLSNILEGHDLKRLNQLVQLNLVVLPKGRLNRGGAFEFVMDPQEQCQKILEAQKEGLDQIGLFHSHPDHPAEPSVVDISQPMLAGWASVIVAVHQGQFKAMRSWLRNSEGEAFQEQDILVE
jgi:proteasome lid subunit RPN8/RPN11